MPSVCKSLPRQPAMSHTKSQHSSFSRKKMQSCHQCVLYQSPLKATHATEHALPDGGYSSRRKVNSKQTAASNQAPVEYEASAGLVISSADFQKNLFCPDGPRRSVTSFFVEHLDTQQVHHVYSNACVPFFVEYLDAKCAHSIRNTQYQVARLGYYLYLLYSFNTTCTDEQDISWHALFSCFFLQSNLPNAAAGPAPVATYFRPRPSASALPPQRPAEGGDSVALTTPAATTGANTGFADESLTHDETSKSENIVEPCGAEAANGAKGTERVEGAEGADGGG